MGKVRLSGLGEGRVARPSPLKRVTILGMGRSSFAWAAGSYNDPVLWDDPEHEVWAVNSAAFVFRHHKNFNMHDLDLVPEFQPGNKLEKYRKQLQIAERPVITVRAVEDCPQTLEYPLSEVMETFGECYLRNTVSYMIAYGLLCGVEHFDLVGCDYDYVSGPKLEGQTKITSYENGRCNVEYWLGIARFYKQGGLHGASYAVPAMSNLTDVATRQPEWPGLYGYVIQPTLAIESNKLVHTGWSNQPVEFEAIEASILELG